MHDDFHRNVREMLDSYVLRHLDGVERSIVERHVEACSRCQDELAQLIPVASDGQAWTRLGCAAAQGAAVPTASSRRRGAPRPDSPGSTPRGLRHRKQRHLPRGGLRTRDQASYYCH